MSGQVGKRSPKRFRPNFFTSILMVSLVLFILGIIGMVALHFQEFSNFVKENIQVSVYLNDDVNEAESRQLQRRLETERFVLSTHYISKEEAKKQFMPHIEGEDVEELLGFNPLPASIDLFLKAGYMNSDSLAWIEKDLQRKYGFKPEDIKTDKALITTVDTSLEMAGFITLGIIGILLFIVSLLIDSTIRLAMYSNRFLIKSMQLVGANRWFITRPYMFKSIFNGLLSGLLAVGALTAVIYFAQQQFPPIETLQNTENWLILFASLILLGILISWWSTYRSVTKYLKMKLDELY